MLGIGELILLTLSACSENLFNMTGYLISPSFPGYYLDHMFCTWRITVPSGYVIHLEFHEFRLKDYSKCEDCFLKILDGKDETAPTIGRFCGYVYPPVLVSSSNHFTIVLYCSGNLHKARFKAFYHSLGGMCCIITFRFSFYYLCTSQMNKFEVSTKGIGPLTLSSVSF